MQIKKQFVQRPKAIYGGVNGRKYITIHETGNIKKGTGAAAHANLQSRGYTASWHWQVDDKLAIQSYPHTAQCWHAGDGRGVGNLQSIAIEICVNEDSGYLTAVKNAITLTKMIMAEENIPPSHVVMHHHWSGKNCPTLLRNGQEGITWANFIQQLQTSVNTLKRGNTGQTVRALQKDLNQLDYRLIIDGSFGPATEKAVKFLQSMYGLTVDGIVGEATKMIMKRLINTPTENQVTVLRYGNRGKAVGQLQIYLNELGFKIVVDNSFGSKTKVAVEQFQKKYQLEVDGFVGPKTWAMFKNQIFA